MYYGLYDIFKWLLLLSFFTDFIDGYLARKFKVPVYWVQSWILIGDDLTVLVAMIGLWVKEPEFIQQHRLFFCRSFFVYCSDYLCFYPVWKMTNFHTYLAKLAALAQGVFLLLFFCERSTAPVFLFCCCYYLPGTY